MSDEDRERREQEAIAIYPDSYRNLLGPRRPPDRAGPRPRPINEIIDGLTEARRRVC
jgi:hypothetical protein